jgi:hypothetical protein
MGWNDGNLDKVSVNPKCDKCGLEADASVWDGDTKLGNFCNEHFEEIKRKHNDEVQNG